MDNSGWIKTHRSILNNPTVCKDSEYFATWSYLLLSATHCEYETIFNGKKITLKKGQLITGRKVISEKFHICESKVQRILKSFENEHQIEQQTTNLNRLITVLNWDIYQCTEQQDEQPVNNERTTSEQPVNTNNNKRIKEPNKNNKAFAQKAPVASPDVPSDLFDTFWSAYPRKDNKVNSKKAFIKIKVDDELLSIMLKAIEIQKRCGQLNRETKFIPQPSSWLNGRRWEDEIEEETPTECHVRDNGDGTFSRI